MDYSGAEHALSVKRADALLARTKKLGSLSSPSRTSPPLKLPPSPLFPPWPEMTSAELPFSLASPPSAPCLPVELLAQIVEEAGGDRDDDYRHYRLCLLCLTSKSILPFARQAVYRNISVFFVEKYSSKYSSPQPTFSFNDDPLKAESVWLAYDGKSLEATLSRAPHLAQLVTGLNLIIRTDEQSAIHHPRQSAKRFFRLCPNLTALRSFRTWPEEAAAVVAELLEIGPDLVELKRLELSNGCESDLEIDEIEQNNISFEMFAFKLSSLQVNEGSRGPISSDASPHFPQLSVLSHLKLYLVWDDHEDEEYIFDDQLIETLPKCTRLQILELAGSPLPRSQVARLPLQLHSIRFKVEPDWGSIDILLLDGLRGALRQLVIEKTRWYANWEVLGAEYGWQVECFGGKVVLAR
ncbi:hypothetical protein BCR35DRAFT_352944 [Leucosporidium creatinivorum]|uniref:Uncharacterized protein n=1 Tax=Leucosporidium creatinivorum TaxID=106004 RepID=A0A1Y2F677_9BASI|nr:hypothetical protein BCR35DRAFT_352944 [Leucosporidium creatinivorum]